MKIDTRSINVSAYGIVKIRLKIKKLQRNEIADCFQQVYNKYVNFSDIEKYLLPYNYGFGGIELHNNSLFGGPIFFADVLFLNKKKFNLKKYNAHQLVVKRLSKYIFVT